MDFEEWLKFGYDNGWVGPPICEVHDGMPMSAEEIREFDDGGDPCIDVLRLYESPDHKAAVEDEHTPSLWRASNRGWQ